MFIKLRFMRVRKWYLGGKREHACGCDTDGEEHREKDVGNGSQRGKIRHRVGTLIKMKN